MSEASTVNDIATQILAAFINYGGIAINSGVLFDPLLLHPYPALRPPQGKADVTLRLSTFLLLHH